MKANRAVFNNPWFVFFRNFWPLDSFPIFINRKRNRGLHGFLNPNYDHGSLCLSKNNTHCITKN